MYDAAIYSPETPQDSEQTTLAAAVRTYNQKMLLWKLEVSKANLLCELGQVQLTPRFTWKLRLRTSTSPFGVTMGTPSNLISSDSKTLPRLCNTGKSV